MDVSKLIIEKLTQNAGWRDERQQCVTAPTLLTEAAAALTAERERADKAEASFNANAQQLEDGMAELHDALTRMTWERDDLTRKLAEERERWEKAEAEWVDGYAQANERAEKLSKALELVARKRDGFEAERDDLTRKIVEAGEWGAGWKARALAAEAERDDLITRQLAEVERAAGYTPGGHWPSAAAKIDAMRDDHANTQLNEYHLERELAEAVEVVTFLADAADGMARMVNSGMADHAIERARAFIQKQEADVTDPTPEEIEAAAKIICCGSLPCGGCSPEQYARATKQARIALAAVARMAADTRTDDEKLAGMVDFVMHGHPKDAIEEAAALAAAAAAAAIQKPAAIRESKP